MKIITIDEMRKELAAKDLEASEDSTLFDVFLEGCRGWNNHSTEEVINRYQNIFSERYNIDFMIPENEPVNLCELDLY